jgi:hypothetical protein
MLTDEQYTASVSSSFDKEYFDDPPVKKSFEYINEHFKKYNNLPPIDILKQVIPESEKIFNGLETIEYDIAKNFDHLFEETNLYLKEKAFKSALMQGIDLVEAGKNPLEFKEIIEKSLSKDLKINLGINY